GACKVGGRRAPRGSVSCRLLVPLAAWQPAAHSQPAESGVGRCRPSRYTADGVVPPLLSRNPGRSGRTENMGSAPSRNQLWARPVFGLVLLLSASMPARADLHFPEPRVERGIVRSGVPLAQQFNFVNQGPGAVTITDLRARCGCLAPRLEKRTYQSGESGAIFLEVNTLSQPPGPNAWGVDVHYQDAGQEQIKRLDLLVNLITEVKVEPARLNFSTTGA